MFCNIVGNKIFLALTLFAVISCSGGKGNGDAAPSPAPGAHTEEMAMSNYIKDPDRALELIDSAAMEGNISAERALFLRGCVYLVDESRQDSLLVLLEPALRSGFLSEEGRENVLSLMLSYHRMNGHLAEQSRIAGEMAVYYHRIGNSVMCSRMRIEEGSVNIKLGRPEDGVPQIRSAISELTPIDSRKSLEAIILGYQSLIYYYVDEENAGQIIECASRMLKVVEEYEAYPLRFSEEPTEERAQYIDFRKASAYSFLALGNAKAGKIEEAEKWAAQFESTKNSSSLSRRRVITSAYFEMGKYSQVEKELDAFALAWGVDTLQYNYGQLLRMRSVIARSRGQYEESLAYMERYMNLMGQLVDDKSRAEAAQYAIQYKLHEEEVARDEAEAKLLRKNTTIIIFIVVIVFLVALLVFVLWQRDIMHRKNEVLSRQIVESLEYKDKLEKDKKEDYKVTRSSIARMDSKSMFRFLSSVIRDEKLFLDPAFGRQTLNTRFGVSYNQIGKAFSSEGTTLPVYITDLRLEYACKLLLKERNRSISDVAESSGFSSSVSFGRSFKQKFALTPSEYRQGISR